MLTQRQQDLQEFGLSIHTKVIDKEEVEKQFRKLSLSKHPDKGGTKEAFQEFQNTKDRLIKDSYSRHSRPTKYSNNMADPARRNEWTRKNKSKTTEMPHEKWQRAHRQKQQRGSSDYWRTDYEFDFDNNDGKHTKDNNPHVSTDTRFYFDNWADDLHDFANTPRYT